MRRIKVAQPWKQPLWQLTNFLCKSANRHWQVQDNHEDGQHVTWPTFEPGRFCYLSNASPTCYRYINLLGLLALDTWLVPYIHFGSNGCPLKPFEWQVFNCRFQVASIAVQKGRGYKANMLADPSQRTAQTEQIKTTETSYFKPSLIRIKENRLSVASIMLLVHLRDQSCVNVLRWSAIENG